MSVLKNTLPGTPCDLWILMFTIKSISCFMMGKTHMWRTFLKWNAGLKDHLIIGPLFAECPHFRALTPHWKPSLYDQRNMCHWPKCELIIQLIFPSKIILCNLIKFSMIKVTQNLRFKNFQITLIKSSHWGLPNNTKSMPILFL
jgi:hypothetical protein